MPILEPQSGQLGFFRQVARYVKPYRWMGVALVFSLLFESGVESATRFSFRYLIDEAVVPRDVSKLTSLLLLLAGAGALLTCFCILADYLWAKLGTRVVNDLRCDLFLHVQTLSVDFFARRSSGDVLSCFIADAQAIESCLVTVVPYGVLGIAGIFFSTTLMASIHPLLAGLALLGLGSCFILPRLFIHRANVAAFEMRRQEGRLSSSVQEALQAQSLIKVFGLEKEMWGRFAGESEKMVEISVRANFLSYIVQRIPSLCFFLLCLLILGGSGILAFHGKLSIGEVVSFQVLVLGLGSSIANLTWLTPVVVHANASLERVNEIFRERPHIFEKPDAVKLPPLVKEIRFDNVDFAYPGAEENTLHGISLTITRGELVALVGPSGSGKSSLVHLLLRLYDASRGNLLFDGVDVRGVQIASLRSQIGLVGQDVLLFDMSIRDNIRMGKLDADDAQIWTALEQAEISPLIHSLPEGLDTVVGERGARLSGGERQRLALARALVRQPQILVLDEATSSLDAKSAGEFLATLGHLTREHNLTVVAVTHRLNLAAVANKVIVIVEGRVEDQGSHEELLAAEGTYAALWREASS